MLIVTTNLVPLCSLTDKAQDYESCNAGSIPARGLHFGAMAQWTERRAPNAEIADSISASPVLEIT